MLRLDQIDNQALQRCRVLNLRFRLLEYFMEKPGRVFSRGQLVENIWGGSVEIDERTVDVHVGRLRKALNHPGEKDPIRTVRSAGYMLIRPELP